MDSKEKAHIDWITCIEAVKNIVEVIAIIIAGWWTYNLFYRAEAPSLEINGDISSDLEVLPDSFLSNYNKTKVRFGVTVKNNGKRTFNIDSIRLSVWIVSRRIVDDPVTYVNPDEAMAEMPLKSVLISPPNSLAIHYTPEKSLNDDYVFILNKVPSTFYIIKFTGYCRDPDDEAEPVVLEDFRWSSHWTKEAN